MKLIIDIPESLYKATVNGLDANEIWNLRLAVKNGTQLPKGHGRIIDKCKNCKYYRNPDYTRCHECETERSDKG